MFPDESRTTGTAPAVTPPQESLINNTSSLACVRDSSQHRTLKRRVAVGPRGPCALGGHRTNPGTDSII